MKLRVHLSLVAVVFWVIFLGLLTFMAVDGHPATASLWNFKQWLLWAGLVFTFDLGLAYALTYALGLSRDVWGVPCVVLGIVCFISLAVLIPRNADSQELMKLAHSHSTAFLAFLHLAIAFVITAWMVFVGGRKTRVLQVDAGRP